MVNSTGRPPAFGVVPGAITVDIQLQLAYTETELQIICTKEVTETRCRGAYYFLLQLSYKSAWRKPLASKAGSRTPPDASLGGSESRSGPARS